MGERTSIAWTDATWNPIRGTKGRWTCVRVSPGCERCYAEAMNQRFGGPPYRVGADEARLDLDVLRQPLSWRKPHLVFVASMTDLFGEWVPDGWLQRIFAVMALTPQHTYQLLTKRPERMREWVTRAEGLMRLTLPGFHLDWQPLKREPEPLVWPLPNVWIGTSVEDQRRADERIPHLLATPASIRFLSCEPLLGPVDLACWVLTERERRDRKDAAYWAFSRQAKAPPPSVADPFAYQPCPIRWVITGRESGANRRPFDPDWVRAIRDRCVDAGVALFHKQGSAFKPGQDRVLDGRTWDEMPTAPALAGAAS